MRTTSARRWRAALWTILTIVSAAALAACGDDDNGRACAGCDAVDASAPRDDGGTTTADVADIADVGPCALACPAPTYCDNTGSAPRCRCPEGYAGIDCDVCASGWRPLSDGGACVPSCALTGVCGSGTCMDVLGPVRCTCPLGRVGAACERCGDGLAADDCVGAAAAGDVIVPVFDSGDAWRLARVDPETGALTPLAGRYSSLYGEDVAWSGDTLYLLRGDALEARAVDVPAQTVVADLSAFMSEHSTLVGPALDAAGGFVYAALVDDFGYVNSDSQIVRVDVGSGAAVSVGVMFQQSARAIAWDPNEAVLWVVSETEVARFDPTSGATTTAFMHDVPLHLMYAPGALAVTPRELVLVTTPGDPTAWLRTRCAELAARLGTDPHALAVTGSYGEAVATTLTSAGRTPSLVVYGAAHDPAAPPETIDITVATAHPDDVVCVLLERQLATVRLATGVSPRQVIVASAEASVTVTLPDGVTAAPGQIVTIGAASASGTSSHFEASAVGLETYGPHARDTLVFLDRQDGTARWLTLPTPGRDLPGVTTMPLPRAP